LAYQKKKDRRRFREKEKKTHQGKINQNINCANTRHEIERGGARDKGGGISGGFERKKPERMKTRGFPK